MRRPKSPSASAFPPPSSAPSSHAAWNSRAVLRSQRTQVALARDLDVPGVLALQQLAAARARRTRRRARGSRPAGRCAASSANARREQEVAGGGGDRAARRWPRPSGGRAAAAPRRARRRGPASPSGQLDRDRGAQHAVVVGLGPLAGREEDEQRPQPLAAGARSSRPRARRAARRARSASASSRSSSRVHQRRDVRAARLDDRERPLRRCHHRTVPSWMAMIPPAVRIQRTSVRPAAASSPRQRLGSGEALHRARQVRVGVVGEPAQRGTTRSNQSEKKVDSGGLLRRRDLQDDDPAARLHHARHLAQARGRGRRSCARRSRRSRRRSSSSA